jgi:protocatechuate 3,4-dioxygenase beta subunit
MSNVTPFTRPDLQPLSPRMDAPNDQELLARLDTGNDLTFVNGRNERAIGPVLYIFGSVQDERGAAAADARVEIWQACYSGKYLHPDDHTPYPLDLHFQYWGVANTDGSGRYVFKTILPGAYRLSPNRVRPPHIHYKVKKAGHPTLTTQLYFDSTDFHFEGRTYDAATLRQWNLDDHVLCDVDHERRISRVRAPTPEMGLDPGAKYCRFDVALEK